MICLWFKLQGNTQNLILILKGKNKISMYLMKHMQLKRRITVAFWSEYAILANLPIFIQLSKFKNDLASTRWKKNVIEIVLTILAIICFSLSMLRTKYHIRLDPANDWTYLNDIKSRKCWVFPSSIFIILLKVLYCRLSFSVLSFGMVLSVLILRFVFPLGAFFQWYSKLI